jgi:ankyrin repeat protein
MWIVASALVAPLVVCMAMRTRFGTALLMKGAQHGNTLLIRTLLWSGTDVNAANALGGTALFYALGNGHEQAARLLVDAGARLNTEDKDGNTALCLALSTAGTPASLIDRLLAKGALLGLRSTRNPLLCIENSGNSDAFINILLQHGVNPNTPDSEGYTPLMKFAYEGNQRAVRKLLSSGAQVNLRSANGRTALEEAVLQGHFEITEILLQAGADRSMRLNGRTLTEMATEKRILYERVSNRTMVERYSLIIDRLTADKPL